MPIFWRVLIINGCWILSKVYSGLHFFTELDHLPLKWTFISKCLKANLSTAEWNSNSSVLSSHCLAFTHSNTTKINQDSPTGCVSVCMCVCMCVRVFGDAWTVTHGTQCPLGSGKNTGVGCHFLLQRIFPTQVSNPSPVSPAFTPEPPGKAFMKNNCFQNKCREALHFCPSLYCLV